MVTEQHHYLSGSLILKEKTLRKMLSAKEITEIEYRQRMNHICQQVGQQQYGKKKADYHQKKIDKYLGRT